MTDQLLTGHVLANPRDEDALYRLGVALHAEQRWGAAAAAFGRAGEDYRTLTNLGWNLHLCGRSDEAVAPLLRATEGIDTAEGTPHALLGQVFLALGEDEKALRYADEAVRRLPDSPIAHMARAFALFAAGRWVEGWREYEWRLRYRADLFPARPYPLWRGERVDQLFVEVEQGLGDTIFGLRWLAAARARVGVVRMYVQPELYRWIGGEIAEIDIDLAPQPRPLRAADAWCPLLSLPVALEAGEPEPESELSIMMARRVAKVGVCWRGNPAHEQAHHRDCPLPYWLRLAENPAIELHSLQVGGTQELVQLGVMGLIHDRAPEVTNFADTAQIIDGLDLVISVDTSVAHLAGTMGKPTWLLLNQRGMDYRWGRDAGTLWYPAMHLWRRGFHEDWAAVMKRVDAGLRA